MFLFHFYKGLSFRYFFNSLFQSIHSLFDFQRMTYPLYFFVRISAPVMINKVFYLSRLFIVGIESRINVLSCIIKYYSNFLNFFATHYHALFCIMQAEFVALLLYLQNSVALQHIHQGLSPKKCVNCVISFRLLLFSSYQ